MKVKLLGSISALAMLFAASCSNDANLDVSGISGAEGEEIDVTFAITTESATAVSRAPMGPGASQTISKGQNIDMLFYAVYDDDFTLLTQYGTDIPSNFASSPAIVACPEHRGQAVLDVTNVFDNGGVQSITLRLMRNKTYHIVFWAQSSKTAAFNTSNFRHIEVLYPESADNSALAADFGLNNDELRDAFCKSETFSVSPNSPTRKVTLYRPFAQINIGTTGADINNLLNKQTMYGGKPFVASQITLEGVAKYLDVLSDKVLTDADIAAATDESSPYFDLAGKKATTTAIFLKNKIPAYMFVDDNDIKADNFDFVGTDANSIGEEFLQIDLNSDKTISSYLTSYPTLNADGSSKTEKFKYLSMCYALVPAKLIEAPDFNTPNADPDNEAWEDDIDNPFKPGNSESNAPKYTAAVLDAITAVFYTADGLKTSTLNVAQLPVQRNWRTNIIGGLSKNDGTTPDPSSIFDTANALILRDPNFINDYYTVDDSENWNQSPEISE